ncbi:hypothetical protein [Nocardioides sp. LHG3406-4]|uniref:hypothetical protein n=1 Tax=Nocardioides sp. LHG3406-4 TaxID=2804575 RepID=UPI003CF3E60E
MLRAPLPTDTTRHRVTRRALVVSLSGSALGLAACDLDPRSDDDAAAGRPPDDPDLKALADTQAATVEVAALVAATTVAHPALAGRLAGLVDLHAAHQSALAGAAAERAETPSATATPAGSPSVAADEPQALAAVRAAESKLATQLVGRAQRAESGPFARMLAVMSAALQQGLLALDRAGAAG